MCLDSQVATLDEAVCLSPEATWWLKADGVDVVSRLRESFGLKWSGGVDLYAGNVQKCMQLTWIISIPYGN